MPFFIQWILFNNEITDVDILSLYSYLYNLILKVKYVINHVILRNYVMWILQIQVIFSHLKLCVAVAKHNLKWMKI